MGARRNKTLQRYFHCYKRNVLLYLTALQMRDRAKIQGEIDK